MGAMAAPAAVVRSALAVGSGTGVSVGSGVGVGWSTGAYCSNSGARATRIMLRAIRMARI